MATKEDINAFLKESGYTREELKLKKESEEKRYAEYFEEIMLSMITNGINLTKLDLWELVSKHEVESSYGRNRRWSRTVNTIVKLQERFFCIEWEEGLTEMQENKYPNQPYEVIKHTYEKTITVTEWKRLESDGAAKTNAFM